MTQVMNDMSASDWLKSSIQKLSMRDSVDAANDVEMLARIFNVIKD